MSIARRLREDLEGAERAAGGVAANIERAAGNADQFAGAVERGNRATANGSGAGYGFGQGGQGSLGGYDADAAAEGGGGGGGGGGGSGHGGFQSAGNLGVITTSTAGRGAITGKAPGTGFAVRNPDAGVGVMVPLGPQLPGGTGGVMPPGYGGGGGSSPGSGPGFRLDAQGIEQRLDRLISIFERAPGLSPHTARRAGR